jgi:hypothetical protein
VFKNTQKEKDLLETQEEMVGHLESEMKKMGVRGSTKIARDRDAWKLILKEAKVLNGSSSQWRSEKLLMRHESSSMTHKQSAEVPKGTVRSRRSQTVKI